MSGSRSFKRSRSRERVLRDGREISRRTELYDPFMRWNNDRGASPGLADFRNSRHARNDHITSHISDGQRDTTALHHANGEGKETLAGFIFLCNSLTKQDCFRHRVFGMPLAKKDAVERIVPGTKLFLFDIDRKELYGIFAAVSYGGLNLEPNAFRGFEGSYPAQVRFDMYRECLPLTEDIFKDAIRENYYQRTKFSNELTADQVSKLTQLFCPIEPLRKEFRRVSPGLESLMQSSAQRNTGSLYDSTFLAKERLEHQMNASFTHSMDFGLQGPQFASHIPEVRVPAHIREMEELGRFSGIGPSSAGRQDTGYVSSVYKVYPSEGGYRDPLTMRTALSGPQFSDYNSSHAFTEGDPMPLPQSRHLVTGALPNPEGLFGQNRTEDVDHLAFKYLGAGHGYLSDPLDPLKGLPVNPDLRTQSFTGLQSDPVYRLSSLQQEYNPWHHEQYMSAAQTQIPVSQVVAARGGLFRQEAWNEESRRFADQLFATTLNPITGQIDNKTPAPFGTVPSSLTSTAIPAVGTSRFSAVGEPKMPPTTAGSTDAKSSVGLLPTPVSGSFTLPIGVQILATALGPIPRRRRRKQ